MRARAARLVLVCALLWQAVPALADARVTILIDKLRIAEVVSIMREEGIDYAQTLNDDLLDGQGGSLWLAQIDAIYNPARMTETIRAEIEQELEESALIGALAFFDTERGQRIVSLENAARRAMADAAIEEAARARYAALEGTEDARLALIDDFVALNDLMDRNVSGAMSANFQFLRGMADGRALEMSEEDMLADVWGQEDDIREDTQGWLYGYLLLAYQPLDMADLEAYVAFSDTAPGRSLNAALFAGYEAMYRDISYALGRAVALSSKSSDL